MLDTELSKLARSRAHRGLFRFYIWDKCSVEYAEHLQRGRGPATISIDPPLATELRTLGCWQRRHSLFRRYWSDDPRIGEVRPGGKPQSFVAQLAALRKLKIP